MDAKKDLTLSVVIAIFGTIIAFVVCNLVTPATKPYSVKGVSDSVNANLSDPDPEVFNYKALNPTVEVYVGDEEAITVESESENNQENS